MWETETSVRVSTKTKPPKEKSQSGTQNIEKFQEKDSAKSIYIQ